MPLITQTEIDAIANRKVVGSDGGTPIVMLTEYERDSLIARVRELTAENLQLKNDLDTKNGYM